MISLEFLRQFKIFEYAVFDIFVATLGMYLLGPVLSKIFLKFRIDIPRMSWVFLTLPIGIGVHFLIGNVTPMTRDFFNIGGSYMLKIVILIFLFLAFRGITIVKFK